MLLVVSLIGVAIVVAAAVFALLAEQ